MVMIMAMAMTMAIVMVMMLQLHATVRHSFVICSQRAVRSSTVLL
jgi:hypothetical protein